MTVKFSGLPAVTALALVVTVKLVAAAGLTVTADDVPVMESVTLSLAVTVCGPAVLNVTLPVKLPMSPATNR